MKSKWGGPDAAHGAETQAAKPDGRSCFVTNGKKRQCLKCGQPRRSRWPGVCKDCKRHDIWKDPGEEDYPIWL